MYTVRATSQADPTKWDEATVAVSVVGVSISPKVIDLKTGGTQQFSASVTGTGNTAVTWSASRGTISPDGFYTAPETPGNDSVRARSQADPTKWGDADVVVTPSWMVYIINHPGGLFTGGTFTFEYSVNNYLLGTAVVWSASAGTIDQQGRFTAPGTPATVTITATSVQEPSVSAKVQVRVSSPSFDGNTGSSPQLLDIAKAYGSTAKADLDKYDFDNSGRVDDGDLAILFREMGW
jgi:hypothetical protein